jgi:hypothetical protein
LQKSLCKASEYDLNLYVISFGQAQLVTWNSVTSNASKCQEAVHSL